MKAVVAAFNQQEKSLVGAFSVITNLRMELFEALLDTYFSVNLMERCCELLQDSIIDPEIKSRICVSVLGKYFGVKINKNIYHGCRCVPREATCDACPLARGPLSLQIRG